MASKEVNLEINLEKTMVITNGTENTITIEIKKLNYAQKYVYLGKLISLDRNSNEMKVEGRVQMTWNKYWSLGEILKSNMPIKIKSKLMNPCLLPCLTYACQT